MKKNLFKFTHLFIMLLIINVLTFSNYAFASTFDVSLNAEEGRDSALVSNDSSVKTATIWYYNNENLSKNGGNSSYIDFPQTLFNVDGPTDGSSKYSLQGFIFDTDAVPGWIGYNAINANSSDGLIGTMSIDRLAFNTYSNFVYTPNVFNLNYVAGANGTITGENTQKIIWGADGTEVKAVADTGYRFLNWSDDITTDSRTDTNIKKNKTITANFEAITCSEGYDLVGSDCVKKEEPKDVCSNIDGVQTSVPEGMTEENGQCVEHHSRVIGSYPVNGSVLGAFIEVPQATAQVEGKVLGASTSSSCGAVNFVRKGYENDPETVKTIQNFLNDYMKSNLVVDGVFGSKTIKELKAFQLKHSDKILSPWGLTSPTGIFYQTTQVAMNNILCPDSKLEIPELVPFEDNPLSPKKKN